MMYITIAFKDEFDSKCGIEIVGVFTHYTKAKVAKDKVEDWMIENGYDDYKVFIYKADLNL